MADRLALDTKNPQPDPIAISDAYRLIRSCPEPDQARQELEADIICGDLKPVATRAIYRQSNKTLMPAKNPVPVDGKVWARIEADEQTDAFWTGNVVRLSGSGGGAVDLMNIVVDPARIVEVANRHGAEQATSSRSRPNAGAPVRKPFVRTSNWEDAIRTVLLPDRAEFLSWADRAFLEKMLISYGSITPDELYRVDAIVRDVEVACYRADKVEEAEMHGRPATERHQRALIALARLILERELAETVQDLLAQAAVLEEAGPFHLHVRQIDGSREAGQVDLRLWQLTGHRHRGQVAARRLSRWRHLAQRTGEDRTRLPRRLRRGGLV